MNAYLHGPSPIPLLGETIGIHHVVGMVTIAIGLALIDGRLLTFLKPRRA